MFDTYEKKRVDRQKTILVVLTHFEKEKYRWLNVNHVMVNNCNLYYIIVEVDIERQKYVE